MGGKGKEREGRGRGLQKLQSYRLSLHLQKQFILMLKVFSLQIRIGRMIQAFKKNPCIVLICYANRCSDKIMAIFQKGFIRRSCQKWSPKIPVINHSEKDLILLSTTIIVIAATTTKRNTDFFMTDYGF